MGRPGGEPVSKCGGVRTGGVFQTSANFFAERPDKIISGVSGIPLHRPDTPTLTLAFQMRMAVSVILELSQDY